MKKQKLITECILSMPSRPDNKVALQFKKNKKWLSLNWQQYYEYIEKLSSALLSLKVKPQDKIAIWANTNMNWAITDMAILAIQGVTVPIYTNNIQEDIEYILNDSDSTVLFLESEHQIKIWKQIQSKCKKIKHVFTFDESKNNDGILNFEDLIDMGDKYLKDNPLQFSEICYSNKIDNIATIVYTSGTTGIPKGVVLTHRQIVSELEDCFSAVGVDSNDITLSFLPYAHILGRVEHWGSVYYSYTLAFAESIEKIKYNLIEIKPTMMISVPRIFEKIYSSIWTQIGNNKIKSQLFEWAISIGKEVGKYKINREPIPILLFGQYQLAEKLVLHKIKEAMGGRVRFAVSGGAPISSEITEFFHAAGVLILQGYGLTETTAAVTVNTPYDYRMDSVGKAHGNTQIKIAEDGEILIKSPKVMKEYYKNPEATQEVLKDGWFATGDIGELSNSGHLKITDRKKDLIKTAGGKYVAPQKLEGLLKLNPIIGNVLVHGDQKKYIIVLVSIDKEAATHFARENNLNPADYESLTKNSQIYNKVHTAITNTNAQLASFESIKKFYIVSDEFTIENGCLTPSLKVKRKVLDKKYSEIISSLY